MLEGSNLIKETEVLEQKVQKDAFRKTHERERERERERENDLFKFI